MAEKKGTPKYNSLKLLKNDIDEAIKYGLGPKPDGDKDNVEKFKESYIDSFVDFLGGSPDKEKVGAMVAASRNRLERIIQYWQEPGGSLFVKMEDLEEARADAIRPIIDYASIVGKDEHEGLDIDYTDSDKEREEERFYANRVIRKLREED